MKRWILWTVLCTVPFFVWSQEGVNEWMKYLPDEVYLCRLSLPGTHDSGAKGKGGFVATQDKSIAEQLRVGIRCFDIRLRAKGGSLKIYHGFVSQGITFEEEVMPALAEFLIQHPTEMLIVSLKDEGGDTEAYRRLLWKELSGEKWQTFLVQQFRRDLTLGECRGKILFLHRFRLLREHVIGGEFAGWRDNASFVGCIVGNDEKALSYVEDEYRFSSKSDALQKTQVALKNIEAAYRGKLGEWFITFASATSSNFFSGATPSAFARRVNALLAAEIEKLGKGGCGIVFLDFVGGEEGKRLVEAVIGSN